MLHPDSNQHAPHLARPSRTSLGVMSCMSEQLSSIPLLVHLFSGPIDVSRRCFDAADRHGRSGQGSKLLRLGGNGTGVLFLVCGCSVWSDKWLRNGSYRRRSKERVRLPPIHGRVPTRPRLAVPDLHSSARLGTIGYDAVGLQTSQLRGPGPRIPMHMHRLPTRLSRLAARRPAATQRMHHRRRLLSHLFRTHHLLPRHPLRPRRLFLETIRQTPSEAIRASRRPFPLGRTAEQRVQSSHHDIYRPIHRHSNRRTSHSKPRRVQSSITPLVPLPPRPRCESVGSARCVAAAKEWREYVVEEGVL
jgi:hypothetical protein